MAVDEFVGHTDRLDKYTLSGWAYSRTEPLLQTLELDVYFAGKRVTTVRPTVWREDLKSFFGMAKTGFVADLSSIATDLLETFSGHEDLDAGKAAVCDAIDVGIVGQGLSLSKELFVLGATYEARRSPAEDRHGFSRGELPWQFDTDFYFNQLPALRDTGSDPELHYIEKGERTGLRPNQFFDPAFYLGIYSDVRAARTNALQHYSEVGRFEGRLTSSPVSPRPGGDRSILFVGHDAYAAGAQRVLLETVRWFQRHTSFDIAVLLLGPGHLTTEFAKLARCYTAADLDADAPAIKTHLLKGAVPQLVYCNTIVTGRIFSSTLGTVLQTSKVLVHCHEMSGVMSEFPTQLAALLGRADLWICASNAIESTLATEHHVPKSRLKTVFPFIEPSTIALPAVPAYRAASRLRFGLAASDFVIVGCGTVYGRKAPDLFVEVAVHMLREHPDQPLKFIWLGEGELKADLEAAVAARHLQTSIQFIGFKEDASDLMAMGDVFFLPSREDPFPLVVLESGQFGIPTVCYADGIGIADFVADGRGLVASERGVESASDALQKLMLDKALLEKLGRGARAGVASRHFTKAAMRRILSEVQALGIAPALSIIVPNFNHERYIDQRLQSIFEQDFEDYEVIILDDCSEDGSLLRIEPYRDDQRVQVFTNTKNSGSVFKQWSKGLELCRAELIWLAESDDYCDSNFLNTLLPLMVNADTSIAFCKTELVDQHGTVDPEALRPYLDRFHPGFGLTGFQVSGAGFVNQGFGALCAIVNASSCILRRDVVRRALPAAQEYQMCGDWRVYLECCLTGSVAYSVDCKSYFRRHSASTVHRIEGTDRYFAERLAIVDFVVGHFWTSPSLHRRIQADMFNEVSRFAGRFDAAFNGSCRSFFARARRRRSLEQTIHVCFYVHGLVVSKGGIERLFALVSAALIDRGYRVSVVCRPFGVNRPVYPLRIGIQVLALDIQVDTDLAALRNHLTASRVDVFVPMLSESLFERVVGSARGLAIPVIASEHNDPWVIEQDWWSPEGRRATFSDCQTIHLLSERFKTSVPNALLARVQVIPNPVTPGFAGQVRRDTPRKRIIAIGRLAPQKQFELLIQAFALVAEASPDWDLAIYGEGELRPSLEILIERLGLGSRVTLPGESDRLPDEMATSDIVACPSRFEGFGMALVEGMAAGLPGLAFADCNGPNDIIKHEANGLLVTERNSDALSRSMARLMSDPDLRLRLGVEARSVALRFNYDRIMDSWDDMIRINTDP